MKASHPILDIIGGVIIIALGLIFQSRGTGWFSDFAEPDTRLFAFLNVACYGVGAYFLLLGLKFYFG